MERGSSKHGPRLNEELYLPRGDFPADRDTLVGYLERTAAPEDVTDAVRHLPDGRFPPSATSCGALGIPTEE